jgi:phosphatidylglycerophosphate synthase
MAGIFISINYDVIALLFLWISGLLDVVDGELARITNTSSKSGAFLDMILDRMVESVFVLGMVIANSKLALPVIIFLISVIFNFSTFLSAGALFSNTGVKSMHYDIGLIERTETFIFLSVAVIISAFRGPIIWILDVLILVTGILRFIKVYYLLKGNE